MTFTLFDVGANWGADSLNVTQICPDYMTYAFEPTPELIRHLTEQSASYKDRYTIIPFAVSDYNGIAQFNVAAHDDWGCSSLLNFSENLNEIWPGRSDFYTEYSIEVPVCRLDGWLKKNPQITKIDYFHCDTQGSDLAVLRGMGDAFSMIMMGVIEVPQSSAVLLYANQHTKEEALDFFSDHGYEVYDTSPVDKEENLYFRPIQQ